jgi:hypothetical protein
MIFGLSLDVWVKILAISMLLFLPIWVIGEMVAGRLTVEVIKIDMEEKNGSEDEDSTTK